MIKVTEHRHRVKGLFLCSPFFNQNPKLLCSVVVTLPDFSQCSVAELPSAQSKLWYFQAPDILFAAIKISELVQGPGVPRVQLTSANTAGEVAEAAQKYHLCRISKMYKTFTIPFQVHILHKELGGYLSLRFAAETVSYLDVFEH